MTQSTLFYSLSNPPTFRHTTSEASYFIEKPQIHDTSIILTQESGDSPSPKPQKVTRTHQRNSFGRVSMISFGPSLSKKVSKQTTSNSNIIPSILFPNQQINKSKHQNFSNVKQNELNQFQKQKFPSTIKPQRINIQDIIQIAGNNLKYIKIKQIPQNIDFPNQNLLQIQHNRKKSFSFTQKSEN